MNRVALELSFVAEVSVVVELARIYADGRIEGSATQAAAYALRARRTVVGGVVTRRSQIIPGVTRGI